MQHRQYAKTAGLKEVSAIVADGFASIISVLSMLFALPLTFSAGAILCLAVPPVEVSLADARRVFTCFIAWPAFIIGADMVPGLRCITRRLFGCALLVGCAVGPALVLVWLWTGASCSPEAVVQTHPSLFSKFALSWGAFAVPSVMWSTQGLILSDPLRVIDFL